MTDRNTPRLETERLILRKFTEDDIEALYFLLRDREVNTFLPWFPTETMDEAARFFQERFAGNYRNPRGYNYAVCLKTDDLGYGLARAFWHQGITTEAASAVLERMKADGIPYVTATHDVKNPRSGSVMKRLGMKYQYSYEEQVQPKDILVTFRMYQLNLDGETERVYKKYWENSKVHFIENGI